MEEVRVDSLDHGEVGISFQEAIQAGQPSSLSTPTLFPLGLVSTISTMTLRDVHKLQDLYCFPDQFHIVASHHGDQVTSGLPGHVALYEELFFVQASVCPFIPILGVYSTFIS